MVVVIDGARTGRDALTMLDPLSPREREVLRMISLGLTNAEIAARLGVTIHAVKFHLAGIYRQLHVSNRTEAAVVYLRAQAGGSAATGGTGSSRARGGATN
jgi:DNA-binding CsgD family transcriptional regulator